MEKAHQTNHLYIRHRTNNMRIFLNKKLQNKNRENPKEKNEKQPKNTRCNDFERELFLSVFWLGELVTLANVTK